MSNKRLIIISAITLLAILLFPLSDRLENSQYESHFAAEKGVMDMTGWDQEQHQLVRLDGEWEFYWNQLLLPEQFAEGNREPLNSSFMPVPSTWNDREVEGQSLPATGSGTYRLKLVNLPADNVYAIKKTNIRFASTIFVDGEKLLEDGRASIDPASYETGNSTQISMFAAQGNELEIIVHVSNHNYINGGIPVSLFFGEQGAMLESQQKIVAWDFVLFAILCGLSIIFFLSFITTVFYRSKDISLLVFSALCLLFAIYNGLIGERPLLLFFSNVPYETVYKVKDIISLASFIVLTMVIYYLKKNIVSLRVTQVVSLILGIFCFIVVVLPIESYITFYPFIIAFYKLVLLGLTGRVAYLFARGIGSQFKTLLVYVALLCINFYSLSVTLFAFALMDSLWLGQVFLISFNTLLMILVVVRFFEAYRTVELMKDQLLRMDQIKDDFLSNTSHELKTPLNAIVNIADTMLKGATGPVNEQQTQNLAIITGSGRKLTYLVNELLDYSKMKHGNIVLMKSSLDVRAVVDSVISVHMFLLNNKPIKLQNSIPESFPSVWADGNRLTQILHNLIGNAVKFTNEGSVTIKAEVVQGQAEIRVEDTGIGIDSTLLEWIFVAFEQASSHEESYREGSGLGLSITKKLVELHGGEIQAHSCPHQGSVFVFTLPMADEDAEVATEALEREDKAGGFLPSSEHQIIHPKYPLYVKGVNKEPILVVDDDFANLQTIHNLLGLKGYTFTLVNSGQAALEEMTRNPGYSLIILDIMMPDMSGYEVLKRLRSRFSPFELPILMLTARNRSEDVRLSLENGANDIVGKPFEAEELIARVQSLTRLKLSVQTAKSAEISFLRSQIKPHFLYNALNSIAELCVEEPRQAEHLIIQLSQYLRKSFDFKQLDSTTTLASELELVQAYVRIEQVRFGSRLQVEYDVEVDEWMLIPHLLLQPLVENAIRHGLMSDMRGGTVRLSAKMWGSSRVRFTIEDNGSGMSKQKQQEVLEGENETMGVGLWNIRKHLQLLYGSSIQIESELGKGTRVSFDIPFEERTRLADAKKLRDYY
ncbi:ATP-binding protein [Bacillus horti]|uniref:histidine kinase n=1 Tax=Caldalkalibacillus horti TaxID=77523 RepID=A0ABT9W2Y4_9BACI|nr:ATP-binding protein [Bacillus horti]MDQ0167205.1 signal transduction histidine kinase [Bacillus horti]